MVISHLLFDLDNTLYPASSKMDEGITSRMIQFIADFVNVTYDEAILLRKEGLPKYGTTLEWLRNDYNLTDVHSFFNTVHPPEEINEIERNPELRELLISFNLPMTVLTNAPTVHADRILEFLNIKDLFLGIYDIEDNKYMGKPYAFSYTNAIQSSNFTIEETLFFDDHKKYTKGFTEIGGKSVLMSNEIILPKSTIVNTDPFATISSLKDIPLLIEHCKKL